jgi:hypothetical protein
LRSHLPVIFQKGQLMWKGLCKHMLVEITNFYNNDNSNYLAIHQHSFIGTLRTLVRSGTGLFPSINSNINDYITMYSVGTEKNKYGQVLLCSTRN